MSDSIEGLDSADDFNEELVDLLYRATLADIDVEGGWTVRNGAEMPDWDVVISEVQKPAGSD